MSTATKSKPKLHLSPRVKSTLHITPLEDRVVIRPDDEGATMRGGLHIPDIAKEKPTRGRLIAVGAGRFERGARVPMEVKVGDSVLYAKYSGANITLEGEEVVIIKASDILAKLG